MTDEAHHRGPASRIRQEMVDEPAVSASIGPDEASLLRETPSHRADNGYAWGLLVHGLLEHAMRHRDASRADLERLARWLTVESPDLCPYLGHAVEVARGVSNAAFWREAKAADECHVEVPFAMRVPRDGGLPTVVHGVIDLVYGPASAWRIIDYKTTNRSIQRH